MDKKREKFSFSQEISEKIVNFANEIEKLYKSSSKLCKMCKTEHMGACNLKKARFYTSEENENDPKKRDVVVGDKNTLMPGMPVQGKGDEANAGQSSPLKKEEGKMSADNYKIGDRVEIKGNDNKRGHGTIIGRTNTLHPSGTKMAPGWMVHHDPDPKSPFFSSQIGLINDYHHSDLSPSSHPDPLPPEERKRYLKDKYTSTLEQTMKQIMPAKKTVEKSETPLKKDLAWDPAKPGGEPSSPWSKDPPAPPMPKARPQNLTGKKPGGPDLISQVVGSIRKSAAKATKLKKVQMEIKKSLGNCVFCGKEEHPGLCK